MRKNGLDVEQYSLSYDSSAIFLVKIPVPQAKSKIDFAFVIWLTISFFQYLSLLNVHHTAILSYVFAVSSKNFGTRFFGDSFANSRYYFLKAIKILLPTKIATAAIIAAIIMYSP